MSQIVFGSGVLTATPLVDALGNAISNPTPVPFAEMQDVSVDFSFESKKLYGNKQFPIAVGRGKGSITAKASIATVSGALFNSVFFGQTYSDGYSAQVQDVAGQVIPASPFEITVVPPDAGVFSADMGVRDENGNPLARVGSAPATGQYSVDNTGKYTFATTDEGNTVYINYHYTVATGGGTIELVNQFMGVQPSFRADLYTVYKGKSATLTLVNVSSDKLSLATKQDDFAMPELSMEAFANGAGSMGYWSFKD